MSLQSWEKRSGGWHKSGAPHPSQPDGSPKSAYMHVSSNYLVAKLQEAPAGWKTAPCTKKTDTTKAGLRSSRDATINEREKSGELTMY